LNTVDICPVGALTSTDFRFKMRVWFLKQTNSIDTESSVGSNTVVWSREGVIHRITPRRNDEVNDTWMSDSGRSLFRQVQDEHRLVSVTVGGHTATEQDALAKMDELFRAGGVAVVGSGRSSVEEQFLTRQLAVSVGAKAWLVSRLGEGDGILISADRNPNVRGALVTGLVDALPEPRFDGLAAQIDQGLVKTVVSVGEDLAGGGLAPAHLDKVRVIYLGTHRNSTSVNAAVVLPGLTVFEKSGTLVNQQFRIQKFSAAVPPVPGAKDDLHWLSRLVAAAGGAPPAGDLQSVWATLPRAVPALAGLSLAGIPDTGLLLDPTPWKGLPFAEGPSLHHKPSA
jgi:NADH-quinone oxidoreductase subunit G